MALNIKNDETQRLAHELAEMTDESLTAAVTEALLERLERLRKTRGTGLASRLLRIGKECAAQLQEPYRSMEHGDLLYDDQGLPK
jgi:antitoxin VapB